MTIEAGPNIVNSGLVLNLDAASSKSYPGSGTAWTDLSVNGNNGVLVNSPTFDSTNQGSLVFNGSSSYATLPNNLLQHETGNPFTFSFWFKTSSSGVIFGQQNVSTVSGASAYVPAIYIGSNGFLYTSCFWGNTTSNTSVSSSSVNDNAWKNIIVTFSSGSQTSYLNGVSYATLSKTQFFFASTYYYFVGAGTTGGWPSGGNAYFNGNISNVLYYTRALSSTEVSQNFNALRGRYGI